MLLASLNPMVPTIGLYEVGKPCLKAPEENPRKSGFGRRGGRRAGDSAGLKSLLTDTEGDYCMQY